MAENQNDQKDQSQTQGGQRQGQGSQRQPGGQQGDNFATQADGERTARPRVGGRPEPPGRSA